jgi:hypothetical protein
MAIITNQNIQPSSIQDEVEIQSAARKKTKIRVAVAGALSAQSVQDLPPTRNYALAEVNIPTLTPIQQLEGRIRQLGPDSLTSLNLLKSYWTAETRVAVENKMLTGAEVFDQMTEALNGMPALKQIVANAGTAFVDIEKSVQNGTLSHAQAAVQILTLSDSVEAEMAKVSDQYVNDMLSTQYNNGQLSEQQVKQAVTAQFDQVVAETKAKVSTEKQSVAEQVAQLQKELDAISNSGKLDIDAILIKLMTAMNQLRVLANKAKAREREATLTLQLESADDTREKGIAQMTQALVGGIIGMVAGTVTMLGGMFALFKGNQAQKAVRNGIEKEAIKAGTPIDDDTVVQQIIDRGGKAFDRTFGLYNAGANGLAQVIKGGGDAASGSIGVWTTNVEGRGKENDAYAQAASGRADAAAKMAEDLLQGILKMIDNLMQLNNIINQGASNIIQKI